MTRPSVTQYERELSFAISPEEGTLLHRAIEHGMRAHPGLSGFRLILQGQDALLVRLALIQCAQRSLDLQYYSFQNDASGKLLLHTLLEAADRGVRVRILVDDITIRKTDGIWFMLQAHPRVELRIFNPFATRDQGLLGRLGNMLMIERFSKRMHNKAFIADNQIAITGGRNLGDAYFDSSQDFNFRDVDILMAGPITSKMSHSFDAFWNSPEAFPLAALASASHNGHAAQWRAMLRAHWQRAVAEGRLEELPPIATQLREENPPMIWASVELAADPPAKVDGPSENAVSRPTWRMIELASRARHEFIVVSPYLVPGPAGVRWLRHLADRGVKVRLLTNSLASSDVIAVYAGYKRYRAALVAAGIDLYEMKPIPGRHPRPGRFSSSSRASLHTKMYMIDRREIIIGTMNFDPRSIRLNTEIALVIHNQALGRELGRMFDQAAAPASSYHVRTAPGHLDASRLIWVSEENNRMVRYSHDPRAGLLRNVKARLFSFFPFEDHL